MLICKNLWGLSSLRLEDPLGQTNEGKEPTLDRSSFLASCLWPAASNSCHPDFSAICMLQEHQNGLSFYDALYPRDARQSNSLLP